MNDFTDKPSGHFIGGQNPSAAPGDNSAILPLLQQLNSTLSYIEKLNRPRSTEPDVVRVLDDIYVNIANMRSIYEQLQSASTKPKWKPWVIGGRVHIRGGIYAGQYGKLLGMSEGSTAGGQVANVRLEGTPDPEFDVEVGVAWIEGA